LKRSIVAVKTLMKRLRARVAVGLFRVGGPVTIAMTFVALLIGLGAGSWLQLSIRYRAGRNDADLRAALLSAARKAGTALAAVATAAALCSLRSADCRGLADPDARAALAPVERFVEQRVPVVSGAILAAAPAPRLRNAAVEAVATYDGWAKDRAGGGNAIDMAVKHFDATAHRTFELPQAAQAPGPFTPDHQDTRPGLINDAARNAALDAGQEISPHADQDRARGRWQLLCCFNRP